MVQKAARRRGSVARRTEEVTEPSHAEQAKVYRQMLKELKGKVDMDAVKRDFVKASAEFEKLTGIKLEYPETYGRLSSPFREKTDKDAFYISPARCLETLEATKSKEEGVAANAGFQEAISYTRAIVIEFINGALNSGNNEYGNIKSNTVRLLESTELPKKVASTAPLSDTMASTTATALGEIFMIHLLKEGKLEGPYTDPSVLGLENIRKMAPIAIAAEVKKLVYKYTGLENEPMARPTEIDTHQDMWLHIARGPASSHGEELEDLTLSMWRLSASIAQDVDKKRTRAAMTPELKGVLRRNPESNYTVTVRSSMSEVTSSIIAFEGAQYALALLAAQKQPDLVSILRNPSSLFWQTKPKEGVADIYR